jgi:hypothetical protein
MTIDESCPNWLLKADQDVAKRLFAARSSESVSDVAGDFVAKATGLSQEQGKILAHAVGGAVVGSAVGKAFKLDQKNSTAIGALVAVFGLPWIGSIEGPCD